MIRDRRKYDEKIEPFQSSINEIIKREQIITAVLKKDSVPVTAARKRLGLVNDMLNLTSNYILQSSMAQTMLGIKNTDALNEARKSIYKALNYLEEVIGRLVDAPYSDFEEKLEAIRTVSAGQRYNLIRKMGLAVYLLIDAGGENSKYKWAFVELEGRYAAAVKNILDLKAVYAATDPRSPDYEPTIRHVRLMKKMLMQAADRYRNRYEFSTHHVDDFKQGMEFLSALRRITILMGERDMAETVKKKFDVWAAKLENDLKKRPELSPGTGS
ncbi:hypothetical protein AGMMS49928_08030 [Spirochaetia bacterium]|nr:hypothetical protein AGMMS49928_08030 [Spirochaetia bacterium]